MITVNLLRILSLIVAKKYWGIVRYFYYLEVLNLIIESLLPVQRGLSDQSFFCLTIGSLFFATDYFHFWPALVCTQLQTFVYFYFQSLVNEQPLNILQVAINCFQSSCYILMVHLIITNNGFIYVRAECLSEGQEKLLNSLDEGIILFNQNDNAVVFSNKSA